MSQPCGWNMFSIIIFHLAKLLLEGTLFLSYFLIYLYLIFILISKFYLVSTTIITTYIEVYMSYVLLHHSFMLMLCLTSYFYISSFSLCLYLRSYLNSIVFCLLSTPILISYVNIISILYIYFSYSFLSLA